MEFFPSSGHMIGSKRSRPTSASSRKGSSGIVCGGQRSRPGRWKTRSTRSLVGSSDGDGVRAGVVSELDIFYFRKMAISLQDKKLEQQIDHEIRMRDGTAKLLAASKNPDQLLEAAKNLHTSNARMLAYLSELQRRKTDEVLQCEDPSDGNQVPCKAKVSLSDLRIPLLWKEADHFKNKDHRRYAVFCLVKIGTNICDTTLLKNIDRTCTDLTFDDVITFDDVPPDFECQLEVYCHRCQDDLSVASTPKRIKKKIEDFSNSVGRSVGKRLSGMKYETDSTTIIGPKFDCIASATLKLADVDSRVSIFNLVLESDNSFMDLPLFGNFCCCLAAQPHCLIHDTISGPLYFQDPVSLDWELYLCRLCNLAISCWKDGSDSEYPDISIPVTKTTQVSEVPASLCRREHCIQIISDGSRYNLAASDARTKKKWWDAIYQHLLDQVMWLQACEHVMEIKTATPQRHRAYGKSMFTSLYDSTDDPASPMTRVLNRLNIPECDEEEIQSETTKMTANICREGKVMSSASKMEPSTSQNESDAGASSTSIGVPSADGNDDEQTQPASDGHVILTGASIAAGHGASECSPDTAFEPTGDVLSEMCSHALADVAICAQSDDSDELNGETPPSRQEESHPKTSVANMLAGDEHLCDEEFGNSRKDDSECQEAQTGTTESSGDCSGQLDEYSRENIAENSWFQLMRRNEEECAGDEEDGACRDDKEEEWDNAEECKSAIMESKDVVMKGMDKDDEHSLAASLDLAQSNLVGEGLQSNKTVEPNNEREDRSGYGEHEVNLANGDKSDSTRVTDQKEGIKEAKLFAAVLVDDDDSNLSGGNSHEQHSGTQPEEGQTSETDQLTAIAEPGLMFRNDEFVQLEKTSGSRPRSAGGHTDQSGSDADSEHDDEVCSQADDTTKMDEEHKDDDGKGKQLETETEDDKTLEGNEEAASAKINAISRSQENKTDVCDSDVGHENYSNPETKKKDVRQSKSVAQDEEERSRACTEKAEDVYQSAYSADCDSESETVERCVGQSENDVKNGMNPGDEGHSDVAQSDEDLKQSEADQLETKPMKSFNESEEVTEVGEKTDAGNEVPVSSESGNEGSVYLKSDGESLPETCAQSGTSSEGDEKTSPATKESVNYDENTDRRSSVGNTLKCAPSCSLNKETSV